MPAADYPAPIRDLVAQFKSLPGLGPRSAERLVLWLMGRGASRVGDLAAALEHLQDRIAECPHCGFFLEKDAPCMFCDNPRRNHQLLCIVETAADVLKLERSGAYTGLYHVLGGKLSPLDNITPSDLRIASAQERVQKMHAEEIIIALSSDVEGEATANYLADLLRPTGIKITRLAQGMPAGGGLEHVDELTLHQALSGRRAL